MVIFKGFEVTIQVNGNNLEEYLDELKEVDADSNDLVDEDTVTRYVEASTGAEFSISFQYVDECELLGGSQIKGIVYEVVADGSRVRSPIAYPPRYERTLAKAFEKRGGKCFERNIFFANLEIVDTNFGVSGYERAREMAHKVGKIGIIEVIIMRFTNIHHQPLEDRSLEPVVGNGESVPEAALKGDSKSHYVRLGDKVEIRQPRASYTEKIDSRVHPYAKFQFKYCSRRCLEEMLIVPRPPTLEERNVEDLSRTELEELVALFKKRQSEQSQIDSKIKLEPGTGQVIGVKRQRESDDEDIEQTGEQAVHRGGSTIPIVPGETVDLTDE